MPRATCAQRRIIATKKPAYSRDLTNLLKRLAGRDRVRTEADVQSDVKMLLAAANLNISQDDIVSLEVPVGDGSRRRVDIEVGNLAIEVKRDLRKPGVFDEAIPQLAAYVQARAKLTSCRYIGLVTDGADWRVYHLANGSLEPVTSLLIDSQDPDVDKLTVWLEAILATQENLAPSPFEIERRLGSTSPSYELDHASLVELYRMADGNPEVELKRELWAKLLRTALGSAFVDNESLFVDHTLLVLSAELVAHAVLGYNIIDPALSAATLVRGEAFSAAQIYGVVEADFFDWVLDIAGGKEFVTSLARRLARFRWKDVEHDVLKVLYQSIIDAKTRHDLGEYFTPDWLAEKIIEDTVSNPLEERILDPACGSGTFLFHAIRRFLSFADSAKLSNGKALQLLTRRVIGVDVHPVSVTLARVTYLLAIGTDRLTAADRGPLPVPVYLGDSIQWDQHPEYLSQREVRIPTSGTDLAESRESTLFSDDLIFPSAVLRDAGDFDRLVSSLADRAITHRLGRPYPSVKSILNRFAIPESDRPVLEETFRTMCRLHAGGRNHIWGYYVRNLIRPLWLAQAEHTVDVLVGNPPWLAYNYMTPAMQRRFTQLARERGLIKGRLAAATRDLAALFVCRTVELYLRVNGRFGFVMPRAALSRRQYQGFRTGRWSSSGIAHLNVTFVGAWDLDGVRPHLFRVPASVVIGSLSPRKPLALGEHVKVVHGRLPKTTVGLAVASQKLSWTDGVVRQISPDAKIKTSPYKARFRQGAVLAPQFLVLAVDGPANPLGAGAGRVSLKSRRSIFEGKRWCNLTGLSHNVESQFIRPTYLGQSILPYYVGAPTRSVLPISGPKLMSHVEIEEYDGLNDWWTDAERLWDENKVESDKSTLLERINFHQQLTSQLEANSHRVVYTKAGNRLAAARISDHTAIIDFSLYWGAAVSSDEALYLTALLNCETVLGVVAEYQARGLFGARHFDKYVWNLPIPEFNRGDRTHVAISQLTFEAEQAVAALRIPPKVGFQRARKLVREELQRLGIAQQVETQCEHLLDRI